MEQKKNYMKPEFEEVVLSAKTTLLSGSDCDEKSGCIPT